MPAVHRPLAVVRYGIFFSEPPLERGNIIGAECDVAALKGIDDVIGAKPTLRSLVARWTCVWPSVTNATGAA